MKKYLSVLLAVLLILSLAACGGKEKPAAPDTDGSSVQSALDLLTQVWDSYGEDEKFSAAGGDMTEENMAMDMPGKFGVGDAQMLDSILGFPGASVEKIDEAASLVHMINANTFTCGAFHAVNTGDVEDLAAAIKDNIMQRHWMCGFPDKLAVVKLDGYVVSVFGHTELVDTFVSHLNAVYPAAETFCDEPIG